MVDHDKAVDHGMNTPARQSSVEMKTLPVNLHVKHTVAVHRLLFAVVQTDARTHTA